MRALALICQHNPNLCNASLCNPQQSWLSHSVQIWINIFPRSQIFRKGKHDTVGAEQKSGFVLEDALFELSGSELRDASSKQLPDTDNNKKIKTYLRHLFFWQIYWKFETVIICWYCWYRAAISGSPGHLDTPSGTPEGPRHRPHQDRISTSAQVFVCGVRSLQSLI